MKICTKWFLTIVADCIETLCLLRSLFCGDTSYNKTCEKIFFLRNEGLVH
jgi:hypothetical protein